MYGIYTVTDVKSVSILSLQIEKMSLTVEASKLLDFNQKLDIPLLDNVIGCMYNGIGEQVRC